jgi:hypothetical protein
MEDKFEFGFGAFESPVDKRTFSYLPTTAANEVGEKWEPEFIDNQHRVGICTAIWLTMRAKKNYGIKFNADFQYLCQKKFYDNNWDEGSSILHSLKVGKGIGFLPESEWTHTTEDDRNLSYAQYIEKLKAIPDDEIERLKKIAAKYKLAAYAQITSLDRDTLANAIANTGSIGVRFVVGSEWFVAPIEPLRSPKNPISGHAINDTKSVGNSFRLANSWGKDWADNGTAYHLLKDYAPTEAWSVWFADVPPEIQEQVNKKAVADALEKMLVINEQMGLAIQDLIKVVNQ